VKAAAWALAGWAAAAGGLAGGVTWAVLTDVFHAGGEDAWVWVVVLAVVAAGVCRLAVLACAPPSRPGPPGASVPASLIDPERLELLAGWLDADDQQKGRTSPGHDEAQADLRRWARVIRTAAGPAGLTRRS
jgi:MFS family permease